MRPSSFADFHGQTHVVGQLKVATAAAKRRAKPLGHVLLAGPPGCGKTTLGATVLPGEMRVTCRSIVCSAVEDPKDMLPTLTTMREGEILFLDEIHALPRVMHETLYSVMEDFQLTVVTGDDANKQVLKVALPRFTIVGATTREGLLPEPLRDRFTVIGKLELYTDQEMPEVLRWIVDTHEDRLPWEDAAVSALVPACHGTARHAVRLVGACADTVLANDGNKVSAADVAATLARLEMDPVFGLSKQEIQLLRRLASAPRQTLGLSSLGAMLDEEESTVEDVYEPWLLQRGLIVRSPQGRTLTAAGQQILRVACPP